MKACVLQEGHVWWLLGRPRLGDCLIVHHQLHVCVVRKWVKPRLRVLMLIFVTNGIETPGKQCLCLITFGLILRVA